MTDELFNIEWTTGDMSNSVVSTFAKYLGMFCMIVISIVGFGIVEASIFKNCLAGLYAVAPKFWDRVDEVKKAGLRNGEAAGKISGGNNEVMKLLGSVSAVMLSILPNVKAMTEFEDEVLDAKAYFMKAIPLLCLQVFIGVFVFFGYPAQVAQKFSEFGTGMFNVVLTNVDPAAWVEALPDKLAVLKFSTDQSMDDVDQAINKVSKKVAQTYLGAVNDVTKEKRLDVALDLEAWVMDCMSECTDYCNSDKYDLDVTATVYKSGNDPAEGVARVHGKTNEGITTFAWYKGFNDGIDSGTAIDCESWFIRFDLRFTAVASKGNASKDEVTFCIPSSNFVGADGNIEVGGITNVKSQNNQASGKALMDGETVSVIFTVNGSTMVISPKAGGTLDAGKISEIAGITGLSYKISSSVNPIRNISIEGSEMLFKTANGKTWKMGEDPTVAGEGTSDAEEEVVDGGDSIED